MADNSRVIFSTRQISLARDGTSNFTAIHGLENMTMSLSFDINFALEIGQLSTYQAVEDLPNLEATFEKKLDGYPPVYMLATYPSASASLAGRGYTKTIMAVDVFSDQQDAASGQPISEAVSSGMQVNSVTYNFPVTGFYTESVSLIGQNRTWTTGVGTFLQSGVFDNTDSPRSITGSGGINMRQHMLFDIPTGISANRDVNGQVDATRSNPCTILPGIIEGITSSGTNPRGTDGYFKGHLQDMSISASFNREPLLQQGNREPYFRSIKFPIEVTTEVSALASKWDEQQATEAGIYGNGQNTIDYTIKVAILEGLYIDLGTKNRLRSVAHEGGGVDGSNLVYRYTFVNSSYMNVYHPADPSGL